MKTSSVTTFKNRFQSYQCEFCFNLDTQQHALSCKETTQHLDIEYKLILQSLSYNDLFGPVEEQLRLVKILKKLIIIRKNSGSSWTRTCPPWLYSGPSGWCLIVLTQWKYIIIIINNETLGISVYGYKWTVLLSADFQELELSNIGFLLLYCPNYWAIYCYHWQCTQDLRHA